MPFGGGDLAIPARFIHLYDPIPLNTSQIHLTIQFETFFREKPSRKPISYSIGANLKSHFVNI